MAALFRHSRKVHRDNAGSYSACIDHAFQRFARRPAKAWHAQVAGHPARISVPIYLCSDRPGASHPASQGRQETQESRFQNRAENRGIHARLALYPQHRHRRAHQHRHAGPGLRWKLAHALETEGSPLRFILCPDGSSIHVGTILFRKTDFAVK